MSKKRTKAPTELVMLHIELEYLTPTIWRDVRIPISFSLENVHIVIQCAMGWLESHLHEFEIGGVRYGVPEPDWDFGLELTDERSVTLETALGRRRTFRYVYDFGDWWQHKISVKKAGVAKTAADARPICLAGEYACPPEDVGGPPGYAEFLQVLFDPKHPDREDLLEWVGKDFDPAVFDIETANADLAEFDQ
jgi:hypothetical protein